MLSTPLIIGIIVLVVVIYVIFTYNRLVSTKTRADNAWSQIDVQLKRRSDLIPNLVNTVKGYVKHEKGVLESVTKARSAFDKADKANDMKAKAKATSMMTDTLKTLFAVAENYPKLQANENFMMLQEELSGTESKIAYARQFYNDTVERFNTMLLHFPTNTFGKWLGFSPKEFFAASEGEKKLVKVEF